MTNAKARKLATKIAEDKWIGRDARNLARFVLTRLGQEDVMDADPDVAQVQAILDGQEETEPFVTILVTTAKSLLKKLRAVTPAVTLPTWPPKTISRGGIGWSHDDDPLVK